MMMSKNFMMNNSFNLNQTKQNAMNNSHFPQYPRNSHVETTYNHPTFDGSDVYVVKKPICVGGTEKRFIRILWGDGAKGHEARWIGFAPTGWKMNHSLATDPQLLGFYVKPKLCDRSTKTNKKVCSGWVTLTIDCERRAIKATIDGWTLGKVFIPTWLLGRVMRPVAVSENGTPVTIDISGEDDCQKVIRAGFSRWETLENNPLSKLACGHLGHNYERDLLGMSLSVTFDEDNRVTSVGDSTNIGYISYTAVDMGVADAGHELIPLVVNDQHAFRCHERGLWDLFYADGRRPLDYLVERMSAIMRKIFLAKQRRRRREYNAAMAKLAHFRHILFFLACRDQEVVEDANSRVRWFLMNSANAGSHKEFTPDLCQLLICLAVSNYDWEDVAVPFFSEALQRAIPEAMKHSKGLNWCGPDCCELEDMFEALMLAPNSLSETLMQVFVFIKILKPTNSFRRHMASRTPEEYNALDRVSAEELCCGLAGLDTQFRSLMYERSTRKDDIKKCVLKREWQEEFTQEQWDIIQATLVDPSKVRGMLFRARMLAECHGTNGLPTKAMLQAVDQAHELGRTAECLSEVLAGMRLAVQPGCGEREIYSIVREAVGACRRKGYLTADDVPPTAEVELSMLLSARKGLRLSQEAREKLIRENREEPIFMPEVLPAFCASSEGMQISSSCSVSSSLTLSQCDSLDGRSVNMSAEGCQRENSASPTPSDIERTPTPVKMNASPQSPVSPMTSTPVLHFNQASLSSLGEGQTSPLSVPMSPQVCGSMYAHTPTGYTPGYSYTPATPVSPLHQYKFPTQTPGYFPQTPGHFPQTPGHDLHRPSQPTTPMGFHMVGQQGNLMYHQYQLPSPVGHHMQEGYVMMPQAVGGYAA